MSIIKVVLSVCLSSFGGDSAMDAKAKEVRQLFPHSKVAITFKQCDENGKQVKGKKVSYTQ